MNLPVIRPGERTCIAGPSGSGKTILAKILLRRVRNAMIVDTKRVEDWNAIGKRVSAKQVFEVKGGRFYYPVPESFIVDKDEQDRFFRFMKAAGHRTVYIDEAYDVLPSHGIKILATQGRATKASLMVAMQRPSHIPLFLVSEAQHFFIFYLRLEKDRKRIEDAIGARLPWSSLRRHKFSFIYVNENGKMLGPMKVDKRLADAVG